MEEKRFDDANKALTSTQLFTNRVMSMMQPTMMLIMNGLIVVITWTAAHKIDEGSMQVGQMTAFITYSMLIVLSFLMMSLMSIMLPRAGVAADRIEEVLTTESSITDPENPEEFSVSENAVTDGGEPKKQGKRVIGEVDFSHVDFRYPGAEEDVLHDIDFTAEAGKTTAIIGSTGSGKSTLINLIPRFYDVTGGAVSVNGTDVRKVRLEDLRKTIGFIPQKGVLFSGTIADNLRFGNENATDEELREAADIAQASEFIFDNDEGMERHVSQGGSNVSGGQKQRLAIARALVRKPDILVFDDSFSALDMKTDAKLRDALEEKLQGVTRIIVAQRISTIVRADQIVVLDEGKIAGKGTHRELMESCKVYREIAESQLSPRELRELAGEQEGGGIDE
jgi:ATP-binding cassette subfamily B protein